MMSHVREVVTRRRSLAAVAYALIATALVVLVGGAMVVQAINRPPWLDELTSLWFVHSPTGFLNRYSGDPHPFGYYIPLYGLARIWESVAFLRIAVPLVLAAWCVVLGSLAVFDRGLFVKRLGVTLPAAFGSAAFVEWGLELRMYGALAFAVLVLATTVSIWVKRPKMTPVSVVTLAALTATVATLNVWGTLIAAYYAAVILSVYWAQRKHCTRRTLGELVGSVFGAALWIILAYAWGPLSRSYDNLAKVAEYDNSTYFRWLREGVSPQSLFLIVIVGFWVLSLIPAHTRRTLLAFDIAALTVAVGVAVISQWIPLVKVYSVVPVVVLVLAGAALRLYVWNPAFAAAFMLVLLVNGMAATRGLGEEREGWQATTRYLLAHTEPDDACPVLVFPTNRDLFHTEYFLNDYELLPFDAEGVAQACDEGWFVMNHAGRNKKWIRELERLADLKIELQTRHGSRGFVGRYVLR